MAQDLARGRPVLFRIMVAENPRQREMSGDLHKTPVAEIFALITNPRPSGALKQINQ